MRPIFETCTPRPEVLQGELTEDIFAARLKDVIDASADPVYRDAELFFENTYPTEGLRALLEEALGRLTGQRPASNPIIRLETAFGGGKTHNLIGLFHSASGAAAATKVVSANLIPTPGEVLIAGVVGSDLDPTRGIRHPDRTTYTLWGEVAYQLGKAQGYDLLAESDAGSKAAPGTGVWDELIGNRPALIMLDEVARHLRTAKAVATGTGKSNLAEQTVAFLMSLLEYAASREHVVVVLTLADEADAFGQETEELKRELGEASRVSARQERVITPTSEVEIAAIVTHRLFNKVDQSAAQVAAATYTETYQRLLSQGVELPQKAGRAEFSSEMAAAYPFHPELLNTLNRKVSTIPNFQKTRGALRLLAVVVRRLWQERPAGAGLIHPHHIDLRVTQIADDLTSRLGRPAFQQVIDADIGSELIGSQAHAQVIDSPWIAAGKPPYAQRVATTVFLHSLTQVGASGVVPAELMLAVLEPSDDPTLIAKAAERLVDSCWFLDYDGQRYRFKTEPALNKIVADEVALVGKTKAKAELDGRIRQIWRKGVFLPAYFPSEAADVDDDANAPKLAIIHYDAATTTQAVATPPDLVRKLAERAGTSEGYRIYRNNVLFLVADQGQLDRMVEVAQRYLAIDRIVNDAGRMTEFNEEQRKKLRTMQGTAELDVRVAITRAYSHLFYPSADAPSNHAQLSREVLQAQDQGEIEKDQSQVILRVLRQLDKVQTADANPLAPTYVKAKAWDSGQGQMTTEDLRRNFAKRVSLRMLLDLNQLKKTVAQGVQNEIWIYYDAVEQVGYNNKTALPSIQIGDDTALYLPEEARRLQIRIKGEEKAGPEKTCPVCGNPISRCTCDDEVDDHGGGGEEVRRIGPLRGEGVPSQAFQKLLDQCSDHGVKKLVRLTLHLEGTGKAAASDLRALGLAIPQLGKGQFQLQQNFGAEFAGEQLSVTFTGGWDRYKRLKTLTESFGQEASKLNVRTKLQVDFSDGLPVEGDQLRTIREVFASLDMGKIVLDAEPARE